MRVRTEEPRQEVPDATVTPLMVVVVVEDKVVVVVVAVSMTFMRGVSVVPRAAHRMNVHNTCALVQI